MSQPVRNAEELPAVGSPVDQPVRPLEAEAWMVRWCDGICQWVHAHASEYEAASEANRKNGWRTDLYALADDEVAAVNKLRAQKAKAAQVDMKRCQCDHNEYCSHCWPEDFRPGGVWHGLGA